MPSYSDDLLPSLISVAPQLLSFEAETDGWLYYFEDATKRFDAVLDALRDVRHVKLGCTAFQLSSLLARLQPLQHLHTVVISGQPRTQDAVPVDEITSTSALDFIAESASIRFLTLPRELEQTWTAQEIATVRSAAAEKDVSFRLG